jgi:site-specific recombinase XerD
LTRAGIAYILQKYADIACKKHPELIPKSVSPHHLRHSRAMHLLQSSVPLIYIRDFLGHSEISTTEIYARCDSKQKREAFEAAQPELSRKEIPIWQSDDSLLHWLKSLC